MFELPDQIFEQYNRAQVNTMMGLFAEINHAWVSIDNALYLWDYTHPNPSLLGFEEQPNSITAVKMVRPRPGVFVSSITRLLVVATTTDIFLIGVAVQTNADGARSVSLYQTNMQVSIKGISVHVIAGSDRSGRIFFAGRADDDIYELTYQQEEKWFSSRCNKVNHSRKGLDSVIPSLPFSQKSPHGSIIQLAVDDTRDIVYSLTSRSTLKAFHMRTIAVFEHCITRTQSGIMADVRHRVSTTPMLPNDTSIVSVAPIPATEGGRFSLVATTSTGCRLYFSSVHGSYYSSETRGAMSSIQVYHIRFPPADSPTTVAPQPAPQNQAITYPGQPLPPPSSSLTQTRTSERYPPGFFLCFHQKSADAANDSLFMSAPEPGRVAYRQEQGQGQTFQESGQWVGLGGRMEDIGLVTPAGLASSEPLGFGNEMAVQYDQPVCEIAVLTNSGVSTFRRRRLVDVFAAAIRSGGGDDGLAGAIRNFNRNYGRGETVATAIAVICGQASDVTSDSRIARITDPSVLEYARKAFIEHGGKPTLNENTVIDQRGPNIDNVSPSPRHEGLALYLSRLLRSVWRTKILTESQNEVGGIRITSTVPLTKLQDIQRSLQDVKEFLDQYKNSIEGLAGPDALTRLATRQEEIAQSGEHRALQSLYQLISHVIEGLAFVLVLFDEHVNETVFGLDEAERNAMRQMTFERLFCGPDGSRVAKELVKQIVNRNINLGSNVDTVTDALRRKCGSFCSAEDCTIFKAQEEINKATEIDATSESSRHLLNQSLLHLQHVASCLPMEQFKWAVDSYVANEFYAGAIELALKVASEKDRGNRALAWYNEGQPRQDDRALAYDARIKCYDLIHQVITAVDQVFDQSPEIVDGFYTVTAKRRREAYNVVNESKDELFQINLYDWYLSNNWSERLLDVRSDFVEKYLKRRSQDEPDFADLLWRYYAHYNSFIEAAKVQLTLAKSVFDLSLERRIEYLSFARANASTKTIGISEVGRTRQSRQELMREVSDLMDIANLQSDVLDRIKSEPRLSGERRAKVIADLDGRVKTIDELYNGYTDQADYHDLSLLIYSIADHRNAGDIRATWSNLIEAAHDKAMRSQSAYDGPSPYEVIPEVVQTMGTKLQLSETFFPMGTYMLLSFLTHASV